MRRRRRRKPVPVQLVDRIDEALAEVDVARRQVTHAKAQGVPLLDLRAAHADLRHAYDEADALLRRATELAKQDSYPEWSRWRHRLSTLDTARQVHLLAEQDTFGLLPIGSVRAIDTGMSGPAIGDLQHGRSRPPGSAPTYGLDLEALLTGRPAGPTVAEQEDTSSEDGANGATVLEMPLLRVGSPSVEFDDATIPSRVTTTPAQEAALA